MPQRPVPGRQPANVYRVRRAIAATIAVVVLFLLWQLVSSFTGGGDETTATTAAPTTTTTLAPPPDCPEGDVVVAQDPDVAWSTILVDTARSLPPGYGPGALHHISDAGFPFPDGLAVPPLALDAPDAMPPTPGHNRPPLPIHPPHPNAHT